MHPRLFSMLRRHVLTDGTRVVPQCSQSPCKLDVPRSECCHCNILLAYMTEGLAACEALESLHP